jgi:hypothetical protein
MTDEAQQHLGWLKQYVGLMSEDNWRDMKLRCERQLEALSVALSAACPEDKTEAVLAIEFAVMIDDHYERLDFLNGWLVGDTTEWPEFTAAPSPAEKEPTGVAPDNLQEAWQAISLIHEALGEICPPGSLPSEEQINASHGPTFLGYAEALVGAVQKLRTPTGEGEWQDDGCCGQYRWGGAYCMACPRIAGEGAAAGEEKEYDGKCVGGPLDGDMLNHYEPRFARHDGAYNWCWNERYWSWSAGTGRASPAAGEVER